MQEVWNSNYWKSVWWINDYFYNY